MHGVMRRPGKEVRIRHVLCLQTLSVDDEHNVLTPGKIESMPKLSHEVLIGQLGVSIAKDFKGACGKRMLAFIRMNQQRQLPILPLGFLLSGIEGKAKLLERIQLEGPQDAIDLIVSVNFLYLQEELLQSGIPPFSPLLGSSSSGEKP